MGLDMYVFSGTPEDRDRMWEKRHAQYSKETEGCFTVKEEKDSDGELLSRVVTAKRGKKTQIAKAQEKLWAPNPYEVWYWRKHPNLHGWMEKLWEEKGLSEGKDGGAWGTAFNGEPLPLTEEDILRLKDDIENDRLPRTAGFFFGYSDGSEKEGDLEFVEKALELLRAGETLHYNSSW